MTVLNVVLAQTTKPVIITEYPQWFPIEMASYACMGAAIAVCVWVLQQQRRAGDEADATPKLGPVGMGVIALCTFLIGFLMAIGFTKVVANYFVIEDNAYVNGIATTFGILGVPIAFLVVKVGDWVSKNPVAAARAFMTRTWPPSVSSPTADAEKP